MTRLWWLPVLALLLSACQTRPVTTGDFTRPEQIKRWEMNGKLGYRTPEDGGSATFDWEQAPRHGAIHFSGPLGFGSAELTWRPGMARLDGRRRREVHHRRGPLQLGPPLHSAPPARPAFRGGIPADDTASYGEVLYYSEVKPNRPLLCTQRTGGRRARSCSLPSSRAVGALAARHPLAALERS